MSIILEELPPMKTKLSSRERVLCTLRHQEPDRVPIDCGGHRSSGIAAMTYARAHATDLGINGDWTKKHDAHVHVPSGAVPKDGPSAGVAIAVGLVSALTNRPVRKEIAMTGEISLRGRVMAIGGVKEKVLAAHRAGITELMLPKENERDLEDIPAEVRGDLTFHWVDELDAAIELALTKPGGTKPEVKVGNATDGKTNRVRPASKPNGKAHGAVTPVVAA